MDRKKKFLSILTAGAIFATSFAGAVMADSEPDLITVDSVTEAILYDNAAESEIAGDVISGDNYTVTALQGEGAITVAIEATGVKLHENAEHTRGYWIGFAVKAPDGATKATGTFGGNSFENEPVVVINENNDEGIAFYVNAGALVPKTEATLQWLNNEGAVSEEETFVIDLTNVTLDVADYSPVVVNANIADYDEVRDVYDADSYTTDYDETTGIVTVEATGLKEHTNGNSEEGYWTGFAVEAPENATQFKYAFGESADADWEAGLTLVEDIDGQGKEGVAFITNAEAPKRFVKLQWFDVDGNVLTDEVAFEMNLDGVKLNWISEETVTLANSTGTAEVQFETEQNDGVITVKYEAEALDKHANGLGAQGYWVGFAVEAPNAEAKANLTFGEDVYTNMTLEDIDAEKKGIAFYTNAGALEPKTEATLQWVDASGNPLSAPTTFVVDLTDVVLDLGVADYSPVVVNANIADYDEVRDVYDADSYVVDYDENTGIVTVEATGLKEHTNGNVTEGYWTGFAVEAPENATQFKYAFGESADADWEAGLTLVEDIDGQGKEGVAFITNAEAPKRFVKLQWFDVDGNVLTDEVAFEMNLDGVKLNWISEETVTLANSTGTAEVQFETEQNDGVITVKYEAEALDKHANGLGAQGYWVGFAVEAPNAEAKANLTFGEDVYTNMTLEDIDAEKKGIAFYTNAGAAEPKTEATLQWVDASGKPLSAPTTFVIDLTDVVLAELPYIDADAVKEAKIVDQSNTTVNPYSSYSVSAETDENGVILVDINMKNLKSHKNALNESGHWTGFAVVAPDNATTMRYAFAADKESLSMTTDVIETGVATVEEVEKNGVAFYTNAKNTPKKYVRLQWFDVNGDAITNATDFVMDISGVQIYSAPRGGGGSSANYYTVKFNTNGGTAITSVNAQKETVISAPAAPFKEGFLFDGWYIDSGLTQKYDFSAPVTKSFTLYAKWVESENIGLKFTDVRSDAWYYDVVKKVVEKGLMNGISETQFAPELEVTRGMFVTILYRAAGEPEVAAATNFADVAADQYYAKAVAWANANGVVKGITETEFAPDNNITREQMAAILYRYAKNKAAAGEITYTDKSTISDYAMEAVAWAKAAGIMQGNADGTFAPVRNASRAEAAAVFVRMFNL